MADPTPTDTPPRLLSLRDLQQEWNQQADKCDQWDSLDLWEQVAWAQTRAIAADRAERAQHHDGGRWSEGICGDGAAILLDGVPVPIEEVIRALNSADRAERAQPTPSAPPADGEAEELAQVLESQAKHCAELGMHGWAQFNRRAATLLRGEGALTREAPTDD